VRLLEGAVDATIEDPRDDRIAALEDELRDLRNELMHANAAATQAKRDTARALANLRRQLNPLYRALKDVFGELDAAGVEDSAPTVAGASNPRVAAVWESWKSKLGAGAAKCIDALLLHGDMNTQQLSIATGYHRNTVPQYVSQLNKAGLINKNGGRFSLKSL
jgi:hypothetical protein